MREEEGEGREGQGKAKLLYTYTACKVPKGRKGGNREREKGKGTGTSTAGTVRVEGPGPRLQGMLLWLTEGICPLCSPLHLALRCGTAGVQDHPQPPKLGGGAVPHRPRCGAQRGLAVRGAPNQSVHA